MSPRVDQGVDRVAGGAGDRRDQSARSSPEIWLSSDDLPTFGPADDGDRRRLRLRLGRRPRRQREGERLAQVLDAAAVLGRDQEQPVDPQAVELREALARLARVALVDHQDRRLAVGGGSGCQTSSSAATRPCLPSTTKSRRSLSSTARKTCSVQAQRIVAGHQAAGVDDLHRAVVAELGQCR